MLESEMTLDKLNNLNVFCLQNNIVPCLYFGDIDVNTEPSSLNAFLESLNKIFQEFIVNEKVQRLEIEDKQTNNISNSAQLQLV